MRKSVEYDNKTGIVYVHVKKGKIKRTETVYDANVTIVIGMDKKGRVIGERILGKIIGVEVV